MMACGFARGLAQVEQCLRLPGLSAGTRNSACLNKDAFNEPYHRDVPSRLRFEVGRGGQLSFFVVSHCRCDRRNQFPVVLQN